MSRYEMLDYDDLLTRIGIGPVTPEDPWFCGDNPPEELSYEEAGIVYDDVIAYTGRAQHRPGSLCLSEDVNINGLLLNHRDRNGTLWLCTGIEGWWTLPPSEIPDIPQPYWDGSLLTTGRYLARTITISGCFMPPDPALVWYNRDALLRVASIVRGVGLLAMCGNQSPFIDDTSPFFDPPKMAIIQMADVPLVETTKPNGFTQFSLSFRCVQPTKLSLYEKIETLPVQEYEMVGGDLTPITRTRLYKAFSLPAGTPGGGATTSYTELKTIDGAAIRRYSEVEKVNLDALIIDEELAEPIEGDIDHTAYIESDALTITVLRNEGNYFSFPTFVFDEITGADIDNPVTIRNNTTGEQMSIIKPVEEGSQLVIDTNLRRVGLVNPTGDASDWVWNDRSHLSLTSQWISLAPGDNTLFVSRTSDVDLTSLPQILWRDTWIG